jgi:hypothetical protein
MNVNYRKSILHWAKKCKAVSCTCGRDPVAPTKNALAHQNIVVTSSLKAKKMRHCTTNLYRVMLLSAAVCAAPVMAAPDSGKPTATMAPSGGADLSGSRVLVTSATVRCPSSISVQATNAPSPWLAGGVTMNVQSAALTSPSAPVPQMICQYEGSGATWRIYRNIHPEFKTCVPSGTSFVCTKP